MAFKKDQLCISNGKLKGMPVEAALRHQPWWYPWMIAQVEFYKEHKEEIEQLRKEVWGVPLPFERI
jgi:hypothetical protein